jgi:hypothetical protein
VSGNTRLSDVSCEHQGQPARFRDFYFRCFDFPGLRCDARVAAESTVCPVIEQQSTADNLFHARSCLQFGVNRRQFVYAELQLVASTATLSNSISVPFLVNPVRVSFSGNWPVGISHFEPAVTVWRTPHLADQSCTDTVRRMQSKTFSTTKRNRQTKSLRRSTVNSADNESCEGQSNADPERRGPLLWHSSW